MRVANKKAIVGRVLITAVIILFLSQFIQPPKNSGNAAGPEDISHAVAVPASVMATLKVSCYDCHSNKTAYPWYNLVTPVNWWLYNHITDGKRGLNFSTFATYDPGKMNKKLNAIATKVKKDDMPLYSYLWIHKDAVLNGDKKRILIDWAETAKVELTKAQ